MSNITSITIDQSRAPLQGVVASSAVIGIISISIMSAFLSSEGMHFIVTGSGLTLQGLTALSAIIFFTSWDKYRKREITTIEVPQQSLPKIRPIQVRERAVIKRLGGEEIVVVAKQQPTMEKQLEMLMPALGNAIGGVCLAMIQKWHGQVTDDQRKIIDEFFNGDLKKLAALIDKLNSKISKNQKLEETSALPTSLRKMSSALREFPHGIQAPKVMVLDAQDFFRVIIHTYNLGNYKKAKELVALKPMEEEASSQYVLPALAKIVVEYIGERHFAVPIDAHPENGLKVLANVILPEANHLLQLQKMDESFIQACKIGFLFQLLPLYPENIKNPLLQNEFEYNKDKTDIAQQQVWLKHNEAQGELLKEILVKCGQAHLPKQPIYRIPLPFSLLNIPILIPQETPVIGNHGTLRVIEIVNQVGWKSMNLVFPFIKGKVKKADPLMGVMLEPLYEMIYPGTLYTSGYRQHLLKVFKDFLPKLQEFLLQQAPNPNPVAMVQFLIGYFADLAHAIKQ